MDIVSEVQKAVKYTEKKEYRLAVDIYKRILTTHKDNAVVLSLLGLLYFKLSKFESAEKYLLKSYKINPKEVSTIEALGLIRVEQKKYGEACDYFEKIVNETKNYQVFEKYIDSLYKTNKITLAYEISKQYYKLFPLRKESWAYLSNSALKYGDFDTAIKSAKKLITVYPKWARSWLKYGLLLEIIYHDDETACECYKKVLKLGYKTAGYYNLIINNLRRGNNRIARLYMNKLLKFEPDSSDNIFLNSSMLFRERKFKKAFYYYHLKDVLNGKHPLVAKLKHIWDGKEHKNSTLFVLCDQGLGDSIMFSRYFHFLHKKFAKVKFAVHPTLLQIMKRSFSQYKNFEFIRRTEHLPKYDYSVVMSNLPYHLGKSSNFPFASGYLVSNATKDKKYEKQLFNNKNFKIGICWEAGAVGLRDQINRSVDFNEFLPLKTIPTAKLYSVQLEDVQEVKDTNPDMVFLDEYIKNIDDTASMLKNIDALVTVDTSVAHLGGALGVKTFLILPKIADWRWFDNAEKTEWYDSVKIYKQTEEYSWCDVIENVKKDLLSLVETTV